jgi:hypothetical protein
VQHLAGAACSVNHGGDQSGYKDAVLGIEGPVTRLIGEEDYLREAIMPILKSVACAGLVVMAACISAPSPSGLADAALAGAWKSYVNERFGAAADVPADYKAGEAPENDDGLTFTSPEGDAQILVWGALATVNQESFADYSKRLVSYDRDDGWTISYSAGKDDWFAFSGSKGDRIFYEKIIQACNGEIANHVRIEYPAMRKVEFDSMVTHVAKSLHSMKGYQC